ncbi:MAG: response regulator transcription factor [Leptospiraceae bacterium]|nr:response regulator transcription factor [Leptospiraceae bacterium]
MPLKHPDGHITNGNTDERTSESQASIVGIVENDAVFRAEAIRRLSELPEVQTPVLEWSQAEHFLRDERRTEVEILFVDIMLSGISGIELAKTVQHTLPNLRVIMLTNMNSDEMIFDSIKFGTLGYILKSELEDLDKAVRIVQNGGAMITPTIALRVISSFRREVDSAPRLTDRERQVLELMVRGKTIRAVAEFLGLSAHTVHDHIKRIYKKLEVHNRAELVLRAQELSLM